MKASSILDNFRSVKQAPAARPKADYVKQVGRRKQQHQDAAPAAQATKMQQQHPGHSRGRCGTPREPTGRGARPGQHPAPLKN